MAKRRPSKSPSPTDLGVGEAEIHTWGDGWKNLKFLFARRFGLHRTRTPWGGLDSNPDSDNGDLPEQRSEISLQVKVELRFEFSLHLIGSIHGVAFEGWDRLLVGFGCL